MKTMNRIFALVLAIMMVLSLGVTAMADSTTPHTINMTYVNGNHTYDAYQVFAGRLEDGKLHDIVWGAGVNGEGILDALRTDATLSADFNAKNSDESYKITTASQVAQILENYENDSVKLEAFSRVVAANLTSTKAGTSTVTSTGTEENPEYTYSIDVTGDGYYFIHDAKKIPEDDAATKYILQVLGDVDIAVKAEAPVIEKNIVEGEDRVKENEGFIGDTVNYELVSAVPEMDGYNHYFFVMDDTLSKGLTFNNDVVVKIDGVRLIEGTDYEVQVVPTDAGETNIKIVLKNFIHRANQAGAPIVATYSATINEDAVIGEIGNPNKVHLIYSNNPNVDMGGEPDVPGPEHDDVTGITPDSIVKTYLTGIKLNKVDEIGNALTGAKFQISGVSEKIVIINSEIFEVNPKGTFFRLKDGTYTETAPNDLTRDKYESTTVKYAKVEVVTKDTVKTNIVAEGWVDENGELSFTGLGEGKFTITEIVAPDGYNKLLEPIEIETKFNEGTTPKLTITKDGEPMTYVDNIFEFDVVNKTGATLSSTGGVGTTMLYIIGGIMVVAAIVLLVTKKRVDVEAK